MTDNDRESLARFLATLAAHQRFALLPFGDAVTQAALLLDRAREEVERDEVLSVAHDTKAGRRYHAAVRELLEARNAVQNEASKGLNLCEPPAFPASREDFARLVLPTVFTGDRTKEKQRNRMQKFVKWCATTKPALPRTFANLITWHSAAYALTNYHKRVISTLRRGAAAKGRKKRAYKAGLANGPQLERKKPKTSVPTPEMHPPT